MKRIISIGAAAIIVGLSAFAAIAAFGDSSSASTGVSQPQGASAGPSQAKRAQPSLVAVAIGKLTEDDGGTATVDLHAAIRDGKAGGNFRFFSEEYGYYNGGVRTLSVENGVISVTGGGGLFRPDGKRVQVRYSATFAIADGATEITVTGKYGASYTMMGTLDGLIRAGAPMKDKTSAGQ